MKKAIVLFIALMFILSVVIGRHNNTCTNDEDIKVEVPAGVEIPAYEEHATSQLLVREAYTASYNKETRCPNWVAWVLTADHIEGTTTRKASYREDEEVPIPRATNQDYKGSGWSRGHMCPAGDNKWNRRAMYDSFSLVNVCPQHPKLNSGVWNSIEMDCRKWARKYGEVYIVCGPVWTKGKHETIGENKVAVPEAFFKVVLCLKGEPKGYGVIVRNTEGNKKKDLYYNSIDEVERMTGIDFFPALDDDVEAKVEAQAELSAW
jgi:endonuclease G